jgi:hypothetical protein
VCDFVTTSRLIAGLALFLQRIDPQEVMVWDLYSLMIGPCLTLDSLFVLRSLPLYTDLKYPLLNIHKSITNRNR